MKKIVLTLCIIFTSSVFAIYEGPNYQTQFKNFVAPYFRSAQQIVYPSYDGKNIHAHHFKKGHKKLVLVIPGYTQPAMEFMELVYDLKDQPADFMILNLRSQGRSDRSLEDPDKVHVRYFTTYLKDMDELHKQIIQPLKYEEVIILGHSLGGAIAMAHAENNPSYYKGMILSSPMMEIKTSMPSGLAKFAVKIAAASWLYDSYAMGEGSKDLENQKFEDNRVTHSKDRFIALQNLRKANKKYYVKGATYNWVNEAFKLAEFVYTNREKVKNIETLMLLAGKDEFTYHDRQKQTCNEMSSCELIFFKDAKHDVFIEKDDLRKNLFIKLKNFIANGNKGLNQTPLNEIGAK